LWIDLLFSFVWISLLFATEHQSPNPKSKMLSGTRWWCRKVRPNDFSFQALTIIQFWAPFRPGNTWTCKGRMGNVRHFN